MDALMLLDGVILDGPSLEESQRAFYGVGFVLFAVGVGVAGIVSLLGILYMTMVVSPNVTQRFSTALREHNIRSFFVGLPVGAGFTLLLGLFHNAAPLFAVTALVYGVMTVLGLAAAAEDIGRRLSWACGKEGSRASHLASGWLVFAFGSLFPVIGWFLILPYVSLSGLGSVVVGTFSRKGSAGSEAKDVEFEKG